MSLSPRTDAWEHCPAFRCEGNQINRRRAPMRRGAAWVNDQVKRSPSKPFLRWSALAALALAIPMAWLAPNQSTGAHQARPKSRPAAGHGKAAHKHGDHKRATRHRTAVEPSGGHGMPSTARSQYLKTTHSSVLNRMGCAEGRRLSRSRDESAIVVLAFGRPVRRGHGHWGASLFGRGFRSTGQIQRAAQAYARGFAPCAAPSGPHLTVAIGTSNFGPGGTYRHGAAWAARATGATQWAAARELAHRV